MCRGGEPKSQNIQITRNKRYIDIRIACEWRLFGEVNSLVHDKMGWKRDEARNCDYIVICAIYSLMLFIRH